MPHKLQITPPFEKDERIVLTLDAGGTKFSFSAMAGGKQIVEPIEYPSHGDDLDKCLKTLVGGFSEIQGRLHDKPAAISFAFPGPAWYKEGIIGDLGNLPAFRGGVPLGPMLERQFRVPVFINNDGDLFTLGEAVGGFLPEMNLHLVHADSTRQYQNLVGFTLGTGFGGGIARGGELITGDNSAAGEVWLFKNPLYPA
jgi:glucokinase